MMFTLPKLLSTLALLSLAIAPGELLAQKGQDKSDLASGGCVVVVLDGKKESPSFVIYATAPFSNPDVSGEGILHALTYGEIVIVGNLTDDELEHVLINSSSVLLRSTYGEIVIVGNLTDDELEHVLINSSSVLLRTLNDDDISAVVDWVIVSFLVCPDELDWVLSNLFEWWDETEG